MIGLGGDRRLKSRNPKIRLDRGKRVLFGGNAASSSGGGRRGSAWESRAVEIFFWKVGGVFVSLKSEREVYLTLLPE